MLAFAPGITAWGLVTGVAMVKSGLSVPLAIMMSLVVYAGSAQLASLPLLAAGAPIWVVWAAALCVNLRFVIFSAQWRVHIGHLPRAPTAVRSATSLADLNLIAFQKCLAGRSRREDGPGCATSSAASVTIWLCWQLRLAGRHLPVRSDPDRNGAWASPARWRCSGLTYGLMHRPHAPGTAADCGRHRRRGGLRAAAQAQHRGGHRRSRGRRAAHRNRPSGPVTEAQEGVRRRSEGWSGALAIARPGRSVTVVTRNFFLFPDREVQASRSGCNEASRWPRWRRWLRWSCRRSC